MICAVTKGGSVTGKQTRDCFNFAGTILSRDGFGREPF